MSVDGPAAATPYAIHITGVAYETDPDTPIIMFNVPEPSVLAFLVLGGVLVAGPRRRGR